MEKAGGKGSRLWGQGSKLGAKGKGQTQGKGRGYWICKGFVMVFEKNCSARAPDVTLAHLYRLIVCIFVVVCVCVCLLSYVCVCVCLGLFLYACVYVSVFVCVCQ